MDIHFLRGARLLPARHRLYRDPAAIVGDGKRLTWKAGLPTADVITTRIDRLSRREQLTLKAASVVGRSFPVPLVSDIIPIAFAEESPCRLFSITCSSQIRRRLRVASPSWRISSSLRANPGTSPTTCQGCSLQRRGASIVEPARHRRAALSRAPQRDRKPLANRLQRRRDRPALHYLPVAGDDAARLYAYAS